MMKTILSSTAIAFSLTVILGVAIAETSTKTQPKSESTSLLANAQNQSPTNALANPQIDYRKFVALTVENETVRQANRVTVKQFVSMASEPRTIILDTRSKEAFDQVHVRGAVHLNFSDFTEEKLAKVIPNKSTRILIYCNNNFLPNPLKALMLKRAGLALNIPTFVNLRGYGYENVFELADVVKLNDPNLKLAGKAIQVDATKKR